MGVLLEGSVLPCHLVNANRGTFLLLPLFLEHFSQYPLSFHTTMPLNHRSDIELDGNCSLFERRLYTFL